MRAKKKDILYIFTTFIISMIFVTCVIVQILVSQTNLTMPLKKANISKVELGLSLYGWNIPEKEASIYNSLVSKDARLNNKYGMKEYMGIVLFILLPSGICTALLYRPYRSIKDIIRHNNIIKNNRLLKENYTKKYSIQWTEPTVECIASSTSNQQIIHRNLLVLISNDCIDFINSNYKDDIGIIKIPLSDIICFSRFGDFYTSLEVNGGGSSFGRAALGYLMAGPSGAIIASRNGVNSETIVHDNRETLLFIKEDGEEKYIFFEPKFYDLLMHIIPNKEITYVNHNNSQGRESNKLEQLKKLCELKEKGHINESEFLKLKNELLL